MSPATQTDKFISNHSLILLKEIKRYENRSLKKKAKTHDTTTVNLTQSNQSRLKLFRHHLHLTHYQTTNFRLFQTERVCRRQF